MIEKEEKYLECQRKIISELDNLITEAKQIKHNVFQPQMQPKDRCPEVKKYGDNLKGLQQNYHQSAVEFDEELDRREALLHTLKGLKIDREKVAREAEQAHQELMEKGRREWEEYRDEYFKKHPERKARYEAYLAAGGKPIEW